MAATAYNLTLTIRALDGEVQQEIGRATATASQPNTEATGNYLTFDSTKNNFFVVRKRGEIVDMNVSGSTGDTSTIKMYVNGRDVNLSWLRTAIVNTVNNRFPQPVKIDANASVQLMMVT